MDGLAMTGFVKVFGWPSALSAFPVFALLGGITLACQLWARPLLETHGLVGSGPGRRRPDRLRHCADDF